MMGRCDDVPFLVSIDLGNLKTFQNIVLVTSEIEDIRKVLNTIIEHFRTVRIEDEPAARHLLSSVRPLEIRVSISELVDAIAV